MLSIEWATVADYYTAQARGDYFIRGGTPPGRWVGEGAELIGLSGVVTKKDFANAFQGYGPEGDPLIQNAGSEKHQAAWDLTFSDPKSLSVLMMTVDQATRNKILQLREQALDFVLDHLEQNVAFTRRGKDGHRLEKVKLIAARFHHFSSRELDPQVHTHLLLMNIGVRPDGTTGTIVSKNFYDYKMAAGALYRAQLSYLLLKELGLQIRRKNTVYEILGVSEQLCQETSQRRRQIKARLKSQGKSTARAAAKASKTTRRAKVDVPLKTLLRRWKKQFEEYGFTEQEAMALLHKATLPVNRELAIKLAVERGLKTLTASESSFTAAQLITKAAIEAQGYGVSAQDILAGVEKYLERAPIVKLQRDVGEQYYTTTEILATERRMMRQVEQMRLDDSFRLAPIAVQKLIQRRLPITEQMPEDDRLRNLEQRKTAEYLLTSPGRIKAVDGLAGTGKTFVFGVCVEAWEKAGYKVLGVAVAGQAARKLGEETGIESDNLAMRLTQLEVQRSESHDPWVKKRPAVRKNENRFELDEKTIVIMDEASMAGTNGMAKLVDAVFDAKAQLIVCGDDLQLPAIDAGAPFRAIAKEVGAAKMQHITRQKLDPNDKNPAWARDVVKLFGNGNAKEALQLMLERDRIVIAPDRQAAIERLVQDWVKEGLPNLKETLIIAPTNPEVRQINDMCQEIHLKQRHPLTRDRQLGTPVGDYLIFLGDRIAFTKKSRTYDVENGERGFVIGRDDKGRFLHIRKDNGRKVLIPLGSYDKIELGYADTAHSAQGGTFETTMALVGGAMTGRNMTGVQASRAKFLTKFYVDELEAGENLLDLARAMSKEQKKTMAIERLPDFRLKPATPTPAPAPLIGYGYGY